MKKTTFKFFPTLNSHEDVSWASSRSSLTEPFAERFFSSEALQDKLVRAIAGGQVIPIKEVLESFEFVARIRKAARADVVVDLCCGHGLTGMLLGIFEPKVKTVLLVDKVQPASFEPLLGCLTTVAPWLAEKVQYRAVELADIGIETNTSIISAHACGVLTDTCISLAIAHHVNIAVLPCCYPKRLCPGPQALARQLGEGMAFDIHRTYQLEEAGYSVKWTTIPETITPMNRVIIGKRKS